LTKAAACLGTILDKPAILTVEKTAFGEELAEISDVAESPQLDQIQRNDIYRWYLASQSSERHSVKATIIYPATELHIRKHETQKRRMVKETPEIYREHVEKYIQTMKGTRIQWYVLL
jgi:m7GpppX diphosphatase